MRRLRGANHRYEKNNSSCHNPPRVHHGEKLGLIILASEDSRQNNLFDLERRIRETIQSQKGGDRK
jgi:hypothetical protein